MGGDRCPGQTEASSSRLSLTHTNFSRAARSSEDAPSARITYPNTIIGPPATTRNRNSPVRAVGFGRDGAPTNLGAVLLQKSASRADMRVPICGLAGGKVIVRCKQHFSHCRSTVHGSARTPCGPPHRVGAFRLQDYVLSRPNNFARGDREGGDFTKCSERGQGNRCCESG